MPSSVADHRLRASDERSSPSKATPLTGIHEGGCVCGATRYRTVGDPKKVSACSCRWCQKRTGSALGVSVYFEKHDVVFTRGNPRLYRIRSDAGRSIQTQFCSDCGTTVGWTLEFLPDYQGIAGGTFDPPTFWFRPERFVFARSKPDWLAIAQDIEMCQAMPD
ncbi:MAG: GFA family protein [Xanthobacteraceae bacterium]